MKLSRLRSKYLSRNYLPKLVFMTVAFIVSLYLITSRLRMSPEILSQEMLRQRAVEILSRRLNRTAMRAKIPKLPEIDHFFFRDGERLNDTTTDYPRPNDAEYTTGYSGSVFTDATSPQPVGTTSYTLVYDESTVNGYARDEEDESGDDYTTVAPSVHPTTKPRPILDAKRKKERKLIEKTMKQSKLAQEKVQRAQIHMFHPEGESKDELAKIVEKVYDERRATLRKFCGQRKGWSWPESIQTISAPEQNLVVCVVQKAGSTSWHAFVHGLRHPGVKWNTSYRRENWRLVPNLTPAKRRKLLHSKSAVRVITVRHPFARIVSGWNNKFNERFVDRAGLKVNMPGIEKYMGVHPPEKDHAIAFRDLVQYMADAGLEKVDRHFRSMDYLCSPCAFPYDYIVKAETAPEDSWFVTDKVNGTMRSFSKHTFNPGETHPESSETYHLEDDYLSAARIRHAVEKKMVSALFRTVPRETIRVLMKLFESDFKAFGYTFDVSTLELGGYT